jgi:hypothetical protein
MAATAFADGALAVAVGPILRIVGRDGAVVQELRSAEGEAFTTPPAIAPDGSVFVGSAKHIYIAK